MANKPHLVNWSVVCLEKHKGGLGFKSLLIFNKALLGKCSLRFVSERDPIWKRVIVGKYVPNDGGWCMKEVREVWSGGMEDNKKWMGGFQN